jgi:hypothetical protein
VPQKLMTFRQYASSRNLNVSTISRAVAKGRLPTVPQPGGELLIDPAAADRARGNNPRIRSGHGGKLDRGVRAPLQFAARQSGFEPGQRALLAVFVEDVPDLLQRAMLVLGADEINAARAVFAVEEVVQYMAAAMFDDRAGGDYRNKLPATPELEWGAEAAALIAELRAADPAWVDTIDDEVLTDDMLNAGARAKP